MSLAKLLGIPHGVTAIVGGGGKTSLLHTLGRELAVQHRVLLCTSTKFRMPPELPTLLCPTPALLAETFQQTNLLAMGTPCDNQKLSAVEDLMDILPTLGDYVLVEADGARHCPLKAPAPHEPVIPPHTQLVLGVAGMDGIGQPIGAGFVHRPALYAALAGVSERAVVTPSMAAAVLLHPNGQRKNVCCPYGVVLNKSDTPQRLAFAREIAAMLPCPTLICALGTHPHWGELWINGNREASVCSL